MYKCQTKNNRYRNQFLSLIPSHRHVVICGNLLKYFAMQNIINLVIRSWPKIYDMGRDPPYWKPAKGAIFTDLLVKWYTYQLLSCIRMIAGISWKYKQAIFMHRTCKSSVDIVKHDIGGGPHIYCKGVVLKWKGGGSCIQMPLCYLDIYDWETMKTTC